MSIFVIESSEQVYDGYNTYLEEKTLTDLGYFITENSALDYVEYLYGRDWLDYIAEARKQGQIRIESNDEEIRKARALVAAGFTGTFVPPRLTDTHLPILPDIETWKEYSDTIKYSVIEITEHHD